jgi:hypothetical protein
LSKKDKENIELSPKRENFCQEYVIDNNGTNAAIRAGYSKKGADVRASKLLANAKVRARVKQLQAEKVARQQKTADDLLNHLWDCALFDPKSFLEIEQIKDKEGFIHNQIKLKNFESFPGNLITKIKLDKNNNPVIETVSKDNALRLLSEIYFKLKEDSKNENINITFGGEIKEFKK